MRAAYVNKNTDIVENIIIVDSLNDPVSEDYVLVEIDIIPRPLSEQETQANVILQQSNPNYVPTIEYVERPVHIGQTKWNQTQGFYE